MQYPTSGYWLQITITTGDSTVKLSTTRQFIKIQKCTLYEERLGWQTHIDSIQKLSMFEIFLVSSWDISHSQFGIQSQILASRGYRDTANFRPLKGLIL